MLPHPANISQQQEPFLATQEQRWSYWRLADDCFFIHTLTLPKTPNSGNRLFLLWLLHAITVSSPQGVVWRDLTDAAPVAPHKRARKHSIWCQSETDVSGDDMPPGICPPSLHDLPDGLRALSAEYLETQIRELSLTPAHHRADPIRAEASIMVLATLICFYAMQKHLTVERKRCSRT